MEERAPTVARDIPPKSDDLSTWYNDVCYRAELVSQAPVRGCLVLRPYGQGMWERLRDELDRRFKETGHENATFPLLIPQHLLQREAEHIEGFAPEVAWVTIGGGEQLEEPLAIRPTSEVIIGPMYAQWLQSYRDLPILINQWANVVRWEKRTRPFLRTLEFLWQEGHTAHETEAEAAEEVQRMLDVYADVAENVCGVPVYTGEKSESERFAGATHTYSIEALMPDGRALQAGTSHELGQNFARAYDIKFTGRDMTEQHAWTTSWGMSWRMLGGAIMTHGDDRGLRVPPKLAPVEAVIVPIPRKGAEGVVDAARDLGKRLRAAGLRVKVDDRDGTTMGYKANEWDLRGVPLRLELGARDLEKGVATVVRRDRAVKSEGQKTEVPLDALAATLPNLLEEIQAAYLADARAYLKAHTRATLDRDEFFTLLGERFGMVDVPWCGRRACEAAVKERVSATTRNTRPGPAAAVCVPCGEPARVQAYFAQSY